MPRRDSTVEYPAPLRAAEEELLQQRRDAWARATGPLEEAIARATAEREQLLKDARPTATQERDQQERDKTDAQATKLASTIAALTAELNAAKRAAAAPAGGRAVGLSLSGGGLRSATFSLGLLQALAGQRLLRHVDYLSTVSGGSYIGGFLGTFYHRLVKRRGAGPGDVEKDLADPRSSAVDWLRQNGRYLAPGGASDGWAALAVILRNLVAVNVVTWTFVLTLFLGLDLVTAPITQAIERASLLPPLAPTGTIWWSAYLFVPAAIALLAIVPLGLAYWLVPGRHVGLKPRWTRRWGPSLISGVAAPVLAGVALLVRVDGARFYVHLHPSLRADDGSVLRAAIVLVALGVVTLAWIWFAFARATVKTAADDGAQPQDQLVRFRLSGWLRAWLILFSISLLGAVVDSLGQTAYRAVTDSRFGDALLGSLVGAGSGLIALGAGVQKVVGLIGVKNAKVGVPLRLVALVGALVLLTPILLGLSALGHGIAWQWQHPGTAGVVTAPPVELWGWPLLTFAVLFILTVCFGNTYSFLNDSSIASLYASRLTRAYIGASNERRGDDSSTASTDLLPEDVIPIGQYSPHAAGGPLHIINTTLNETVGGQSQVEERDRKGMNLAIGPAGISVGARHHALWTDRAAGKIVSTDAQDRGAALFGSTAAADVKEFRVFPTGPGPHPLSFSPEKLALGRWMAISGAAASTALGSMTSFGLSALCGILNVRLGHWWWSDVDPRKRQVRTRPGLLRHIELWLSRRLPVHVQLFHELSARFPGTSTRSWYLTDGGHFENTGAYELLRRRLKVIILVDNGADRPRALDDLANLVRKARVDLDTHIEFVDPRAIEIGPGGTLDARFAVKGLGTLDELGFGASGTAAPDAPTHYAAIARIRYGAPGAASDAGDPSWLLLVKPGLMGDEPLDVRQYKKANNDFPQQTTADQFFDEAQWEAYRRLGEHIGDSLFGGTSLAEALGVRA